MRLDGLYSGLHDIIAQQNSHINYLISSTVTEQFMNVFLHKSIEFTIFWSKTISYISTLLLLQNNPKHWIGVPK